MDDYAAGVSQDALLDFLSHHIPSTGDAQTYPSFLQSSQEDRWPLTYENFPPDAEAMAHHHQHSQPNHAQQQSQSYMSASLGQQAQFVNDKSLLEQTRAANNTANQAFQVQPSNLGFDYGSILPDNWQYELQQAAQQRQQLQQRQQQQRQQQQQQRQQQQQQQQRQRQQQPQFGVQGGNTVDMNSYNTSSFGAQLQASPVDFMPSTTPDSYSIPAGMNAANFMNITGPMESINELVYPLNEYPNNVNFSVAMNTPNNAFNPSSAESVHSSMAGSSPTGTICEVQSLSDNEWSMVNFNSSRQSIESAGTVSNPSQNLHIRTSSDSSSDDPGSVELSSSYEEVPPWPLSSPHDLHGQDYLDAYYRNQMHSLPAPAQQQTSPASSSIPVSPSTGAAPSYRSSGSSNASPTSSGPTSPPIRRRKSPIDGTTTKAIVKKTSQTPRKDSSTTADKKIGRRRGPLRPDQRQQAHEIRKLRACLRCKFLKKTCDKGEPCGGCRPSHARLWQVPCTRMDIKDISYFMKDWKADYERHVSLGFSVGNIKGFSTLERTLYVTHGYGHYFPITAREVFVHDEQCFGIDWIETGTGEGFEISTAKLSAGMEGISTTLLSEYLDRHLDQNFEPWVDDYFDGTLFTTEILKTAYRYYQREKTPSIRKALKLVLAYNLTLHVTFVEGLSEEERFQGRVFDDKSKWYGKTVAPVMINFQVKCALADMWRELQKDILEELSALYSSVYSGEKLKNWPTIFMLAAILLAIWEWIQFDCYYRIPDEKAVNKFCDDMETTPVGVIVGLFQAISTKLPGLHEWDTQKHHQVLGSNPAVCDALTEVRGHINKYDGYLKERQNAKFDRNDFDCLSNKFLSKLVIRAN